MVTVHKLSFAMGFKTRVTISFIASADYWEKTLLNG